MTTAEAQRFNAERMTDAQLRREFYVASNRPEQPEIRRSWIAVLRVELERRGLTVPA